MANERPYNYLDAYRRDAFAEKRFLEPIVFDWTRVSEVEVIDEVKDWDQSKIDSFAGKKGNVSYHKYLVNCPNHGYFKTLIEDEPKPWSYHCRQCITDEMERVRNLRFHRDREYLDGARRYG